MPQAGQNLSSGSTGVPHASHGLPAGAAECRSMTDVANDAEGMGFRF